MSSRTLADAVFDGFEVPGFVRNFEHAPGTRVHFGPGQLESLGEEAAALGTHAMLVTDPGLVGAGYPSRAHRSLEEAGLKVTIFDEVHENPTTADVRRSVRVAKAAGIDLLVGLGGGSSMDAAKGCNFILTNGGEMKDYWGKEKATQPMLPLIAIPTTAGTGSECQSFALIADEHTHTKMACGDKKAAAQVAILDPELTLSQPRMITAVTAIDAVSHAVESFVSKAANARSRAYALAGFRLMKSGIEHITANPDDLLGRARMQIGAALGGTAIENSMLGAAHGMANPLTARFDIIHGQAVGAALPAVIRRNREDAATAEAYRMLFPEGAIDRWVEEQLDRFGLSHSLQALGVDREALAPMAGEAAKQWTAQFNPVALSDTEYLSLYRNCW